VLQRYRIFPVVPVECQGSRASVPATVVPGYILGSWGQLCCPSNVCMPEGGYSDGSQLLMLGVAITLLYVEPGYNSGGDRL